MWMMKKILFIKFGILSNLGEGINKEERRKLYREDFIKLFPSFKNSV